MHQGIPPHRQWNLIIAGVPAGERPRIEALARQYGLLDDSVKQRKLHGLCSPAHLPLAMAEAERILPAFVTDIEGCWPSRPGG